MGINRKTYEKYTIIHNFTAVASIEVLAETREEAFEKAKQNDIDPSDYEFELDSVEIGHEEDVEDLQHLINKATAIIKQFNKGTGQEDFYNVSCYPTVTTQVWNGDEMVKHKNIVEDFYYDSDKGLMMDVGEGLEVELSELSDMEQLNVCQVIIDSATTNGIEL